MATKKISSFILQQVKRFVLLDKLQNCIREVFVVYNNHPTATLQLSIVSFLSIYAAAQDILMLNLLGMFVLSILTCQIFSKWNLFFKAETVGLHYRTNKESVADRFKIIYLSALLPMAILAFYSRHPFTGSAMGEALLWTFITATSIILHASIERLYQPSFRKYKHHFFLKMLTTQLIWRSIPLGSLLGYIIYLPYLCVYRFSFFLFETKVDNTIFTTILFLMPSFLMLIIPFFYYQFARYLSKNPSSTSLGGRIIGSRLHNTLLVKKSSLK